jgi:3-phosphoshikimate 1-carboxyvinyltransferase
MAPSIAALRATGDTIIHDSEAASISFPEFYTLLNHITER